MTTMLSLIKPQTLSHELSEHAEKRSQQRGVSQWAIGEVITYGNKIHKQGMIFHYLPKRAVEKHYKHSKHNEFKDLVVLTCAEGVVVTVYKNADCIHKIKCKPKRLSCKGKYASLNRRNIQWHRAMAAMAA